VVSNAVRQLQYCVTERAALDCVELFATEQRRGCTGGFCRDAHKTFDREMSYQRKAESILNDENCFKVYIVSHNKTDILETRANKYSLCSTKLIAV